MRLFLSIALLGAISLAACHERPRPMPTPTPTGTPGPDQPDEPFVCPKGMPSWKCDQLKRDNDPNAPSPPPAQTT